MVDRGDLGQGVGFVVTDIVGGGLGETGQQVDHGFALGVAIDLKAALAVAGLQQVGLLGLLGLHIVDVAGRMGVPGFGGDQRLLTIGIAADGGIGQQGDEAAIAAGGDDDVAFAECLASGPLGPAHQDLDVLEAIVLIQAQGADAQAGGLGQALGAGGRRVAQPGIGVQGLDVDERPAERRGAINGRRGG